MAFNNPMMTLGVRLMTLGVPSVYRLSVINDTLSAIVDSPGPNDGSLNPIVSATDRKGSMLPS